MGPIAMILAGIVVASYPIKEMLSNKKVYIATALRLIFIPSLLIAILFFVKEFANMIWDLNIDNTVLYLCFFSIAAPLGLNTVANRIIEILPDGSFVDFKGSYEEYLEYKKERAR